MKKYALTIAYSLALCIAPITTHAANTANTTNATNAEVVTANATINATANTSAPSPKDPYALQITQPTDHTLSCNAMHEEALLMRDIINTTEEIKDTAKLRGHGIKAAGAIGSFLVGSVTGGLGLAAAGFLANNEVEAGSDNADNIQDKAEARRSLMVGLYSGKNCRGSIDYVLHDNANADNEGNGSVSIASLSDIEPTAGTQELRENLSNSAVRSPHSPRYNE